MTPGFERFVELKLGDKEADKEGLEEFISKLKTSLGNSLSKQISFYQAQVDKLYESRAIPGWNYCSFFATKVLTHLCFLTWSTLRVLISAV